MFDLDGLVVDLAGCLVARSKFAPVEGASPKHVAASVGHLCPTCLLEGFAPTNASVATIVASFASVQGAVRLRKILPFCSMRCESLLPLNPVVSTAFVKGFALAFVAGATFEFPAKFVLGVARESSLRFRPHPFAASPFLAPSLRLDGDFLPIVAKRIPLLAGGGLLVGELFRLNLAEALLWHRTFARLLPEGYARLQARVAGQP